MTAQGSSSKRRPVMLPLVYVTTILWPATVDVPWVPLCASRRTAAEAAHNLGQQKASHSKGSMSCKSGWCPAIAQSTTSGSFFTSCTRFSQPSAAATGHVATFLQTYSCFAFSFVSLRSSSRFASSLPPKSPMSVGCQSLAERTNSQSSCSKSCERDLCKAWR